MPVVTSEEEDVEIENVVEETPEISEKSFQQSMEGTGHKQVINSNAMCCLN